MTGLDRGFRIKDSENSKPSDMQDCKLTELVDVDELQKFRRTHNHGTMMIQNRTKQIWWYLREF
ncbi:hypothetical protein MTR_6g079230 [Medicago truncatula]|uniref:Uncharacterized protein n=1 Tax=Medicago truncatula TaxID=3880 RepID=A0A072UBS8_MEDTR|nr:hypothetical protein MTR_6g079230 [Medicago truncatula]